MKNNIIKGVAILAFTVIVGLNANLNIRDSHIDDLSLQNVEALASGEGDASDYWCCGNTGDCVTGTNIVIKGKLKTSPC